MRKYISKIAIIFMMAFVIGIGYGVSAKAADDGGVIGTTNLNGTVENSAKIGDQLKEPEKGWKRYDDTDSRIKYLGSGWTLFDKESGIYNNKRHICSNLSTDGKIKFNFFGTKLRIISAAYPEYSNKIRIKIDGIEQTYSQTIPAVNGEYINLLYEKTGLGKKNHTVELTKVTQGTSHIDFCLDAIDMDDTGNLLPYDTTTLTAAANNKNQSITLNWDKVDEVEKYIIKKSTVQGKEEKIQEVKENSYEDKDVKAGETYYYIVVPVINGKEGTPSNEASATLEKNTEPSKPDTKGDAVLTITMTNGNIKSYNVTMEKVNDFIKWYEGRANGSNGTPFYKFDKTDGGQDFKNKTEYIVFDKISSFEVDER